MTAPTTLGGLELPSAIEWVDRYISTKVEQVSKRTLGGNLYVSSARLNGGAPITLEATENHGWLTRDQVTQLLAMAEDPAGVYTLQFNGVNYTVIFRHDSPPAIDMQAIIPRPGDDAGDYFIGQIKLISLS